MKVVAYARFSPSAHAKDAEEAKAQGQAVEPDSCQKQLADIRTWCKLHNHELVGEFADEALSGADDDRPQLERAIQSLRRGYLLVVRSIDRLARGNLLTEMILLKLARKGAHLQAMNGVGTYKETAEQELMRVIFQALGQYNRRKIRESTSRRMKEHQAGGRRMSARCPFGWQVDPASPDNRRGKPGKLIEHPEEQAMIREVVDLYNGGKSTRAVADEMNARGRKHRTAIWRPVCVHRILKRVWSESRPST